MWVWSRMLPLPETICQLPYSVESDEPDRACSAANLKEPPEQNLKPQLTSHAHIYTRRKQLIHQSPSGSDSKAPLGNKFSPGLYYLTR